mgnify:CR=1 FL=1
MAGNYRGVSGNVIRANEVEVEYRAHPDIETAIASYKSHISQETHARSVKRNPSLEGARKWTVDKMPLELSVKRVGH